jgi:hypothetical protein
MTDKSIVEVNQGKALVKKDAPVFHVKVVETPNPHKAQAFLDYGNVPGPWVKLGINNTVYGFGYLPTKAKVKAKAKTVKV